MRMTKALFALATLLMFVACGKNEMVDIDALSGATPLALARAAPSDLTLTVNGEVKQEYGFRSADLSVLATTRIRTREVTGDGEYLGAYAYSGIPVIHILEGVKPNKNDAAFDRPLDMVVTFTNSSGKTSHFSYNEICMADDALPITLAYYREPVVPSKEPETYTGNKLEGTIEGLRLICPADSDVERYLDDVTTITLHTPKMSFLDLPVQQQGAECRTDSLVRCKGESCDTATLEDVESATVRNWIRIGHGRGFKGITVAGGYRLVSFLEKNFQEGTKESFYLFIACDGYRSLFSGTELFKTAAGSDSLIVTEMDGEPPHGGFMLGPVRDYFIDRDVWGLSHIVQLKP